MRPFKQLSLTSIVRSFDTRDIAIKYLVIILLGATVFYFDELEIIDGHINTILIIAISLAKNLSRKEEKAITSGGFEEDSAECSVCWLESTLAARAGLDSMSRPGPTGNQGIQLCQQSFHLYQHQHRLVITIHRVEEVL